jgi:hypothetical protein
VVAKEKRIDRKQDYLHATVKVKKESVIKKQDK